MRYVIRKDILKRELAVKFEKKKNFIKSVTRTHRYFIGAVFFQKALLYFKRPFIVQVKNRCKFTFTKHSIIRFYNVGRNAFRSNASFVNFFSLQKASW